MDDRLEKAMLLDRKDPISRFRDRFVNDDRVIYLDGNSLGKLPRKTMPMMNHIIKQQWGDRLIRSWNEHWMGLPGRLSAKIAKLIGAQPGEVFVGDTTSVNLFKLAHAALKLQEGRDTVITDDLNFPSDWYVLQGLLQQPFTGHRLKIVNSKDGIQTALPDFEKAVTASTALVTLSYVAYKSAFMYDMKAVNALAHARGSLVIWDLSHAVGAVPVHLNDTDADMAVGCTYKYLNGGPGATAFLYVRKSLQEKLSNPVSSWFGHAAPFSFEPSFRAAKDIQKFAMSTPHILSMAPIEPGLDILLEAGMEELRRKSIAQGEWLLELVRDQLYAHGFEIASPEDPAKRGSHVSLRHPEAYRICKALIEPVNAARNIIPDFRPPDILRIGIAPLYTSFTDLTEAVKRIAEICTTGEFQRHDPSQQGVT